MIVKGKWKLIQFYEYDTIQLYNIEDDISEKTDLSTAQPEVAKALLEELKGWVSEAGAPIPKTPNRSFTADGKITNKGDRRDRKKKKTKRPVEEFCADHPSAMVVIRGAQKDKNWGVTAK